MKRNENFLLREVAGTLVVVPVGTAVSAFPGMITLNTVGAYIWELLETEQTVDSIVQAIMDRYDVEEVQAQTDVEKFLNKLRPTGALV